MKRQVEKALADAIRSGITDAAGLTSVALEAMTVPTLAMIHAAPRACDHDAEMTWTAMIETAKR